MAFNYAKPRATAERLIKRYGKGAFIRRTTSDGTTTPWDPTETTADYPCQIVVTEYTMLEKSNSLINLTDRRVLISTEGLSIEPTASDVLVIDGIPHEIKSLVPLEPGPMIVMYEAQVVF